MELSKKNRRAFVYRAGVRLAGTVIACDAAAGSDLMFLSHASVLGARGRRALPRVGGSRRQVLTTEATLALLGPFGDRLRAQALLAAYGRPFQLGDVRLEVFPSGHLPGAASLLCERGGRRIVYAGPIGGEGDDGVELRAADALCLDARFADRAFAFPARAVAAETLRALARDGADGGAPVLVIDPPALAPPLARLLGAAGVPLRAHRAILDALGAFRRAEPAAFAPEVQRFAGRLAPSEVLLWPADAPAPAQGGEAAARRRVLVSPRSALPPRLTVGRVVTFPFGADFEGLVRYVAATGASEVALVGAPGDELVELLRGRGLDAYRLGPPRQIDLFTKA
jgi:hypothetical protein